MWVFESIQIKYLAIYGCIYHFFLHQPAPKMFCDHVMQLVGNKDSKNQKMVWISCYHFMSSCKKCVRYNMKVVAATLRRNSDEYLARKFASYAEGYLGILTPAYIWPHCNAEWRIQLLKYKIIYFKHCIESNVPPSNKSCRSCFNPWLHLYN